MARKDRPVWRIVGDPVTGDVTMSRKWPDGYVRERTYTEKEIVASPIPSDSFLAVQLVAFARNVQVKDKSDE